MLHTEGADRAMRATQPEPTGVLAEMEARAEREGFPIVGAEVGRFLRWLVTCSRANRVFECGSGFGYSALWIAQAMPRDGELVLTEVDEEELAAARSYLDRAAVRPEVRYEHADALDVLRNEDDQFDLVLLDHENERYREGFEAATTRVRPGGSIVADNVLHSWEFDPADIASGFDDRREAADNPSLAGVLAYYRHALSVPDFETIVLPLGEGIAVSTRM